MSQRKKWRDADRKKRSGGEQWARVLQKGSVQQGVELGRLGGT